MIVIRNTRSTLTQTVMARQRLSLTLYVNLKANQPLKWRLRWILDLRQTVYY